MDWTDVVVDGRWMERTLGWANFGKTQDWTNVEVNGCWIGYTLTPKRILLMSLFEDL
jgi:hypothetical protein